VRVANACRGSTKSLARSHACPSPLACSAVPGHLALQLTPGERRGRPHTIGARWWHTPSLFCIVQGTHGEQPELVQPELSRSRRADKRDRERKTRKLALRGSPIDMPIDRTRTEMGPSHGPSARSMIACTPDQLLPCLMSSDVDRIRGLFLHVSAHVYPSFVNGWFRTAPGTRRPVRARVRVEPSPRAVRGMLVRHEGVLSEQFYGLGLGLGAGQPRRRSRMSSYRNRGAVHRSV